ncbi:uncharacterized protein MONBRDRAFT_32787 [Monosiga brevicollis MX1]|uniref:Endonuclease/exonuclease/phosphatase domain-containing protein n=1 Tax=Monosiga brevicollis TaxID=81824 RepID=A9V1P4_MONBE|nr:uncharacterized protein MONBRDRAFT_32787 [Monosiga brevicollis MX1]EDQ88599.1 predicted protein [Monosiga brevicollis MX1]|eukprot:XP_001746703.1 hypothetical protein [Monosiga brevicollis MX1]
MTTRMAPLARIVTYNVLTPRYCNAQAFPACDPAVLEPRARLDSILQQLQPFVADKSIICLQEVGDDWFGAMHAFFAQNGYSLALYNYKPVMGVGIAWPHETFAMSDMQCLRVGEYLAPRAPEPEEREALARAVQEARRGQQKEREAAEQAKVAQKDESLLGGLFSLFGAGQEQSEAVSASKASSMDPEAVPAEGLSTLADVDDSESMSLDVEYEQLITAAQRKNCLILGRFTVAADPDQELVVATYHMPCAFRYPKIMGAHAATVGQLVQKWAQDVPYVLAGDFNFQPDSDCYHLLTTEPDHTNMATTPDNKFCGTLDYIFLAPKLGASAASVIPHRENVQDGPYPNAREPSDHLLIWADVHVAN